MLPPLKIDVIKQQISVNQPSQPAITLLSTVDSTNDWLLRQIKQGHNNQVMACFAEQQTAGRGRRGNHWQSPAGSGIHMSLAWPFRLPLQQLTALPLAMAVVIKRTLNHFAIDNVELKWPNDVLVDSAKIAGVLIDSVITSDQVSTAVIGIGVNIQLPASIEIDSSYTDIASLSGEYVIDRSVLAGVLLNECIKMCQRYQQQGLKLLSSIRQSYDHYQQQPVQLKLESGGSLEGIALGLSDAGELRVLVDGEERLFSSADVSLRRAS